MTPSTTTYDDPGVDVDPNRLAEALVEEEKLLVELASVFRSQREALVRSDPEAVDESVFAASRIAGTLNEARRRRRILLGVVAGWEDADLRDLDDLLGERMTIELIEARGALQATASELRREVELNRTILRRLMQDNRAHLATLLGGTSVSGDGAGYAAATPRRLLDREI